MKHAAVILLMLALVLSGLPVGAQAAEIQARSALLMELTTGEILQEQNAHEKLAPASVTKIMTMLLIMEAIDAGKIRWEDTVIASETAAAKGGSQVYLKVGENMSVSDMVKAIAVSSANDCACAMAEHLCGSEEAFVEEMNRRARELGMEDTHFVNCTGLDDSPEAAEHLTSAWDIAIMSRELLGKHPEIRKFTTIWMDSIRGGSFGLSNTNKLIRFYKGATGLKTGFTRRAGFCLSASAEREDLELIAVVMGAPGSRQRFQACKSMLDYGFANFALIKPELPEKAEVPVRLGLQGSVALEPETLTGLVVEQAARESLRTQMALEPEAVAPVEKGQHLGTLTLLAGDRVLRELPLLAARAVPRLTWGQTAAFVLGRFTMAKSSREN